MSVRLDGDAIMVDLLGTILLCSWPFIVWVGLLVWTQRGYRCTYLKYSWIALLTPLAYALAEWAGRYMSWYWRSYRYRVAFVAVSGLCSAISVVGFLVTKRIARRDRPTTEETNAKEVGVKAKVVRACFLFAAVLFVMFLLQFLHC